MLIRLTFAALLLMPAAALAQAQKPNDAEIAHIAYTAGVLDVTAGKQAASGASVPSFTGPSSGADYQYVYNGYRYPNWR